MLTFMELPFAFWAGDEHVLNKRVGLLILYNPRMVRTLTDKRF